VTTPTELEHKKDLLRKYAQGLEEIWKRLVDQGPEDGDPLELFEPAIELTEASLATLLK
jgi:hypothetical protein